jgi:hypothetical protein
VKKLFWLVEEVAKSGGGSTTFRVQQEISGQGRGKLEWLFFLS